MHSTKQLLEAAYKDVTEKLEKLQGPRQSDFVRVMDTGTFWERVVMLFWCCMTTYGVVILILVVFGW